LWRSIFIGKYPSQKGVLMLILYFALFFFCNSMINKYFGQIGKVL
jgi:hypothetical protein